MDKLEPEAADRVVAWLAHFHNHYEFVFRWAGWESIAAPPVDSAGPGPEVDGDGDPDSEPKPDANESAEASPESAAAVVRLPADSPQAVFVKDIMARCVRLSYHSKVSEQTDIMHRVSIW